MANAPRLHGIDLPTEERVPGCSGLSAKRILPPMKSRSGDWMRQAEADLDLSRSAMEDEHYEWACFAAQQAAEKAAKAVHFHFGQEAWGPFRDRTARCPSRSRR